MPHKRWSHATSGPQLTRTWSKINNYSSSVFGSCGVRQSLQDTSPQQFRDLISSLARDPHQVAPLYEASNTDDVNSPRKLGYLRSICTLPPLSNRDVTTEVKDRCESGLLDSQLKHFEEDFPPMRRPQHRPWVPLSVCDAYE